MSFAAFPSLLSETFLKFRSIVRGLHHVMHRSLTGHDVPATLPSGLVPIYFGKEVASKIETICSQFTVKRYFGAKMLSLHTERWGINGWHYSVSGLMQGGGKLSSAFRSFKIFLLCYFEKGAKYRSVGVPVVSRATRPLVYPHPHRCHPLPAINQARTFPLCMAMAAAKYLGL